MLNETNSIIEVKDEIKRLQKLISPKAADITLIGYVFLFTIIVTACLIANMLVSNVYTQMAADMGDVNGTFLTPVTFDIAGLLSNYIQAWVIMNIVVIASIILIPIQKLFTPKAVDITLIRYIFLSAIIAAVCLITNLLFSYVYTQIAAGMGEVNRTFFSPVIFDITGLLSNYIQAWVIINIIMIASIILIPMPTCSLIIKSHKIQHQKT